MVLVDSSVWIESLRREGDLAFKVGLEGLLETGEAAFCGPIKLEVLGGARREDRRRLSLYFDCILYRILDDTIWESAKEAAWRLRDKGHTIPWNDILIASCALRWSFRIYAKDAHFVLMRETLGLLLYQPGYGGKYSAG